MILNLSKAQIIIIGFLLWSLIIALPQFTNNYSVGLLDGTLNVGQIPIQFYIGLFSGLFAALVFFGLSYLLSKLYLLFVEKKKNHTYSIFLIITLIFFTLTVFTQTNKVYRLIQMKQEDVNLIREKIKNYK